MLEQIKLNNVYKSKFDEKFRKPLSVYDNRVFYSHGETEECKTTSRTHIDLEWFLRNHEEVAVSEKNFNPCLGCNVCHLTECEYWKTKNLLKELLSAVENGMEFQSIDYAEGIYWRNEELIKEIRKC